MAFIAEGSWIETSEDEQFDASLMFNYMFARLGYACTNAEPTHLSCLTQ